MSRFSISAPGIDGSDVLRRLRNRGNKTPVLVVSARDALDERVQLLDIGADDYLVKPVAMAELEARIRALGAAVPAKAPADQRWTASPRPGLCNARRRTVRRLN